MIGDKFENARVLWHDWIGGRDGHGHPRTCTGTIEHVSHNTVLIRRPRGKLVLKRLSRSTLDAGRLCATTDQRHNVFRDWFYDDEQAAAAKRKRFAEARLRHEAEEAAHRAAVVFVVLEPDDGIPF